MIACTEPSTYMNAILSGDDFPGPSMRNVGRGLRRLR